MSSQTYYILLGVVIGIYAAVSKLVFDRVYETSRLVIDELFHIPQGIAYCENNFTHWDPKITTLPGLYLVSYTFVSTFLECTTYYLRSVNLAASVVNLILFASILKFIYGRSGDANFTVLLQAFNLAILPPLYFFSHLYYTDTLSTTFILALFRLCLINKHAIAVFVMATCSILMRQTNVLWVAMVLGHKLLDVFIRSSRVYGNSLLNKPPPSPLNRNSDYMQSVDKMKLKRYYGISDFYIALKYHASNYIVTYVKAILKSDLKLILTHCIILAAFVAFVIINGSIVVGDKSAHEAKLHLPQMLYFLLFYGFFGLPYVIQSLAQTIKFILTNKIAVIATLIIFLAIVKYNTIIHPYLLADNRHYTFYLWNRWFNKYWFAKYATVPIYTFLFFSLYVNLKDQNCISFLMPYCVCAFAAICLQQMIEIRYFLIPYLILRLRFVRPSRYIVMFETIWYILINAATFFIFINKEFMWDDFEEPQRIMW